MGVHKGKNGVYRRAIPKAPKSHTNLEVMTLREAAEYLRCHYSTVYRLIQQQGLPVFRLGRDWRILKSELDQWIAKGGGRNRPYSRSP
jgi:excisionase family DNA binding protein